MEKLKIALKSPRGTPPEFRRVSTGVEFTGSYGDADVAVVVRGYPAFEDELATAVSAGLPVVVVAGTEDKEGRECLAAAQSLGVPPECIVVKRGDRAFTLAGEDLGPAPGGIGRKVIIAAAKLAFELGPVRDVLVWVDSGTSQGEVVRGVIEGEYEAVLAAARSVVVVFRLSPRGCKVASELAAAVGALHLELSAEPASFTQYGETLEEALATGKYAVSDGKTARLPSTAVSRAVLVDIDLDAPEPEAINMSYARASSVYLIVGDPARGKEIVGLFALNNWRLDGVLPETPEDAEALWDAFGELFIPSPLRVRAPEEGAR